MIFGNLTQEHRITEVMGAEDTESVALVEGLRKAQREHVLTWSRPVDGSFAKLHL